MVHGIRNGLGWLGRLHRLWDWTDGCIAITNDEMQEFLDIVPDGTPDCHPSINVFIALYFLMTDFCDLFVSRQLIASHRKNEL